MTRLSRRGVALMLVLWLLVVLGTVSVGVAASMRAELRLADNMRARAGARYAAESGIVVAVARIEELMAAASDPPSRALLFRELDRRLGDLAEVELGGARFAVHVADLSARVDLNMAGETTLLAFFLQLAAPDRATAIVAALEDWKDADDLARPRGAEIEDYVRAGSRFAPRNGPLAALAELPRVLGVGDSLAVAAAPYVTVHGDGRINLNTAPEPVLAALPGLGPSGARAIIVEREGGRVFTSAPFLQTLGARGPAGSAVRLERTVTWPSRILIVSRGWRQGAALTHEIQAVYAVGTNRLTLRAWEERDR